MVTRVEAEQVISWSREALLLPAGGGAFDPAFLAALVRRTAAYLCPCSPRSIVRSVEEAMRGLTPDPKRLLSDAERAVERAMLAGDLLELSQVTTDDPAAKGTWVFAAPPAFVARPSHSVFLMGITPDEVSPLPPDLAARIAYEGPFRVLRSNLSEDLPQVLRELGLLELTHDAWFKAPRQEAAAAHMARFMRDLSALGPAGDVSGITLLDTALSPTYYRGRWIAPRDHSGHFIARRPQAYGAPLWGFAQFDNGRPLKFLDFPRRNDRWRGSDVAWHLQMALDQTSGAPQRYRVRREGSEIFLDFFSPVPQWAERRLAVIGQAAPRNRSLFSYQIAEAELPTEEKFLREHLWLAPASTSGDA
jgi:hypothetical protein